MTGPYREEMSVQQRCEAAIEAARARFASDPARSSTYDGMCTFITAYLDGYGIAASVSAFAGVQMTPPTRPSITFKIVVFPRIDTIEVKGSVQL